MEPARKTDAFSRRRDSEVGRFERANDSDPLLAQPRSGIPHSRVEVAFWGTHGNQGVDLVAAVNGRQRGFYRAVYGGSQPAGHWEAVRRSHAQIQALALLLSCALAEGKTWLCDAESRGACHSTIDYGRATGISDQPQLRLRIRRRFDFAQQNAEQHPAARQG